MSQTFTNEDKPRPDTMSTTVVIKEATRLHYLDNIRALAMLAGVVFHAALAYSPLMHNLWFTAGTQDSVVIDFIAFFTHLFRMPLFFVISGFFAIMLIEKKGGSYYLKNRVLRLLLPFVLFLPLIMLSFVMALGWAFSHLENLPPILEAIKLMQADPNAPKAVSSGHLWFIFNLFLFVIVTMVLHKLKFFQSKLLAKLTTVKMIVFVLPLLMVPALVGQVAPLPAPDKLYPQLWSFGYYGVFFVLGGLLLLHPNILSEFNRYKNWLLACSVIAYCYFFSTLPMMFSHWNRSLWMPLDQTMVSKPLI